MHICRKWRRLVFSYQQSLQLRLFCTHGTPVKNTLGCWPRALPIVVEYGGSPGLDPPTPEDENEIMAALKRHDRVQSISLTITSSLLEKLSAIKKPFSKLEDLILLSRDDVRLTLPRAFRWGRRLRRLHSTRIVILALVQLHYSSIDLQLHEVPNPWHYSPKALPNALFRMAQLRSLSLYFLPTSENAAVSPPSRNRVVFPVLTRLEYRGITSDLEDLVARIDAPRLEDIEITFSDESITNLFKLVGFIDRIEIHKSHRQAHILSSENAISISLTQSEAPTRIKFQSFHESFSSQLFSMTRILTPFSSFLLDVEDLHVNVLRQSRQEDSSYTGRWLEFLNLFGGVPTLHSLYIPQPGPRHVFLREAVASFMALRRLFGHPVAVEYEQLSQMSELSGAGTKRTQCRRHCLLTRFR